MPKTYFAMEVNTAAESWRTIRSIRADPPPSWAKMLSGDRGREFQSSLEQAQQQFLAASAIGYESRPLNLYYGLAQAGRAIAAVSTRLGHEHATEAQRTWKAVGHGLKFNPQVPKAADLLACPVKLQSNERDLFSRVSLALKSPLDFGETSLAALVSQTPEFRMEFGAVDGYMPELHDFGIYGAAAPFGDGPIAWDLWLPNLPADSSVSEASVRTVIERYPTLRGLGVALDIEGNVERPNDSRHVRLLVPSLDDMYLRGSRFLPKGTAIYRRHDIQFPQVGTSASSLAPLLIWWLTLFALSMLARYSPGDWTSILNVGSSTLASKVELILDAALEAVPDLIAEALIELK